MNKVVFLLFFIMCLLVLFVINSMNGTQTQTTKLSSSNSCKLTVGMVDWQPYQYFKEDGEVAGIQIELVEQIAYLAGCKLSYVYAKPSDSIKQIETGEIDMILSATKTEQREEFALFSTPYRDEMLVLYATNAYAESCNNQSLLELINNGFKLGLQENSIYGSLVDEIQSNEQANNKIMYFNHIEPSIDFMSKHHIDGVFGDPFSISFRARQSDNFKHLNWCRKTMNTTPLSMMFSKKTVSMDKVEKFNMAIAEVKKSDYYRSNWIK